MDRNVKKYFRKVLFSVALGFGWMIGCATAGIYFHLGYWNTNPAIVPILFYSCMAITLGLLLWWYYRTWKK